MRHDLGATPPLFINQLVHVMLRNALDGVEDPAVVRAAELFYRTQRVTLHEGSLIAADEETVGGTNPASVSPLVSMLGLPAESQIDVHQRTECRKLLGTQRPVRHGDRLNRRPARTGGVCRSDAALDRAYPRRRDDHRTAQGAARGQSRLVCRPRCRQHQDRRHVVERRGDRRGRHEPGGRLVPPDLPRSRRSCSTRSKASRSI